MKPTAILLLLALASGCGKIGPQPHPNLPAPDRSQQISHDPTHWDGVGGLIETGVSVEQPQRKPIAAQRPHKVTLVAVEKYTLPVQYRTPCGDKRPHEIGCRIVVDFDPAIEPGEPFKFGFGLRAKSGGSFSVAANSFGEKGLDRRVECELGFDKEISDSLGGDGFVMTVPQSDRRVDGMQAIVLPGEGDVELLWLRLQGKTVYGKDPEPENPGETKSRLNGKTVYGKESKQVSATDPTSIRGISAIELLTEYLGYSDEAADAMLRKLVDKRAKVMERRTAFAGLLWKDGAK